MALRAMLTVLLLSACTDGTVTAGNDTCGMASARRFVGEPIAAAAGRISGNYRFLRPGYPETQDINPARLNLETDKAGRITGLHCG